MYTQVRGEAVRDYMPKLLAKGPKLRSDTIEGDKIRRMSEWFVLTRLKL